MVLADGEQLLAKNLQRKIFRSWHWALCLKIKAEHVEDQEIVIGYDRRFLSKEAVIWACQIFGKQGIKVLFRRPQFSNTVNYVLCDETRITVWPDGDSQP